MRRRLERSGIPEREAPRRIMPMRSVHEEAVLRRHAFQDWLSGGGSGGRAGGSGQTGDTLRGIRLKPDSTRLISVPVASKSGPAASAHAPASLHHAAAPESDRATR